MDILKQIDFVQQFAKEYADGAWSIDVEKWKHHVTPEFIENIRQYIVSLQMKLMHEQTAQAKPFTYLWEADGTCEAVKGHVTTSSNTGPAHGWKITPLYTSPQAAQNEADELLAKWGLDPGLYRTECGFLNHMKIRAALKYPDKYPYIEKAKASNITPPESKG